MITTTDTILAIDLGRYKSVACVYHRSSREHSFRTIDTTPAELTKLLARHFGATRCVAEDNLWCTTASGSGFDRRQDGRSDRPRSFVLTQIGWP